MLYFVGNELQYPGYILMVVSFAKWQSGCRNRLKIVEKTLRIKLDKGNDLSATKMTYDLFHIYQKPIWVILRQA